MKFSTQQYATALYGALAEKSEPERKAVFRNFLSILQKNRDWSRLGLILKEVERLYLKEAGLKKVEVETASSSKTMQRELKEILGKNILIKERVNPEILAGLKILINDEILVDASAKAQINRMFAP